MFLYEPQRVMITVAIRAFDWQSVKPSTLKRMPKSETFVMVATVVLVLLTHNLAVGVVGGVLVVSVLFVRRVANGELLFASSNDSTTRFRTWRIRNAWLSTCRDRTSGMRRPLTR